MKAIDFSIKKNQKHETNLNKNGKTWKNPEKP